MKSSFLKRATLLGLLVVAVLLVTCGVTWANTMDTTQNDVCLSCHAKPVNGPILGRNTDYYKGDINSPWVTTDFSDIHNIKLTKGHSMFCTNCHDIQTFFNGNPSGTCRPCHTGYWNYSIHVEQNNTYITDFSSTTFTPKDPNQYKVASPRNNTDCVFCHQNSKISEPTTKIANHDIDQKHKINLPEAECEECHSGQLTLEHATAGRTDAKGMPITCITCHSGSTKAKIPNYQPFRLRVTELESITGTVGQTVYYDVYTPAKELRGARMSVTTDLKMQVKLQALYNGVWTDVISWDIEPKVNPMPMDNHRSRALAEALTEQVNFKISPPPTKLRLATTTLEPDYYYAAPISDNIFEIKLDNWTFVNPDNPVTCYTCHTSGGHLAKHEFGKFDSNCTKECHKSNLQTEHQARISVAERQGEVCEACHNGVTTKLDPLDVRATIAWGQKNCQNCHTNGHGIVLAPAIPDVIPLNPAFKWSTAMPADLFDGENWIPSEALGKGAKVLVSNRNKNINLETAWNWLKSNMENWQVTDGAPEPGDNFFKATFTQGTKNATIWFYSGSDHNATPKLAAGYKMEIIFWDDLNGESPFEPEKVALPNTNLASNGSPVMANLPLNALPLVNGDYTIEFWAKSNPTGTPLSNGQAYATSPYQSKNVLQMNLPQGGYVGASDTYGGVKTSVPWRDDWNSGWTHWAYVRKGTTGLLFKDGIQVAATSNITFNFEKYKLSEDRSKYLTFSMNLGQSFNGSLDDFRIWGVARTQQEIADNMNYELTGQESGLLGYWKFNENVGSVLKDSTPNGNDGFVLGAKWVNPQSPNEPPDDSLSVKSNLENPSGDVAGIVKGNGWLLDSSGVSKLEVMVDGVVRGEAVYGVARPDVLNVYPEYNNNNAGFSFSLDTTILSNGSHSIRVRETGNNGVQNVTNEKTIIVSNALSYIDLPGYQTLTGTTKVAGWFLDRAGVDKIEIVVDGVVIGEATIGIPREDVYKAYPSYNDHNSGFNYNLDTTKLSNGTHRLIIRETNKSGLMNLSDFRNLSVAN